MTKRRRPFTRSRLTHDDILLCRWLMGDTLSGTAEALNDVHQRGAALLAGIGRVRPLPIQVVANLLVNGDVERLQKALATENRGIQGV